MPFPVPLALSLFYLTSFAVLGVYLPYFNLYLKAIGLSGLEIGCVSALLPLTTALVPYAAGDLADRFGRRKDLVTLSCVLALLSFVPLLFVRNFAGVALAVGLFSILRAPALPLVEATAMEVSEGGGPAYGRMRAWGSVAFILLALATGQSIGLWGERVVLHGALGLLALNALVAFLLPRDRVRSGAPGRRERLADLLRRPRVFLFLLACVLSTAAHGPYSVFYSIHLEAAGYHPRTIGLLWGVAVGCEVVALLRMPSILRRFGTLPTMACCLALSSLRWVICALSAAPAAMALAQSLHAATYAAFHVAALTHTHHLFGEERRASGQSIFGSATYGAGNALGMFLSGVLYDRIGIAALFGWASGTALLGALLVIGLMRIPRGDPLPHL